MDRRLLLGAAAGLAAATCGGPPAAAAVTGREVDYRGWKSCLKISNGTVELVFVPEVGRIMRYGFVSGDNVLWENPDLLGKRPDRKQAEKEWFNAGGDKLWNAPQERWGWPPDPDLDGGSASAEIVEGRRIRVRGRTSTRYGLRFTRDITLAARGTRATLRNTLENAGERDAEWSVWEVAQVHAPEAAFLPLHRGGRHPAGYYTFKGSPPAPEALRLEEGRIRFTRHPSKSGKIGGDSPAGWLSAVTRGVEFRVEATHERGAAYPDDGCSLEIWSNPDPLPYMELELLSPLRKIPPGGHLTYETRWSLRRL